MQEKSSKNNIRLIKTLGEIIKTHRIARNKTIYTISAEAFMSKSTWREVELGLCQDINLTTLWKIAEGLDIKIESLLKEVSGKLGEKFTLAELE